MPRLATVSRLPLVLILAIPLLSQAPDPSTPTDRSKQECTFSIDQTRSEILQICGQPSAYYDPDFPRNLPTRPPSSRGLLWEVYNRKTVLSKYEIHLLYSSDRLQEVRFIPDRVMKAEQVAEDIKEASQLCKAGCSVRRFYTPDLGITRVVGERAVLSFVTPQGKPRGSDWRLWDTTQLILSKEFAVPGEKEISRWSSSSATDVTPQGPSSAAGARESQEPRKGPFGFRFGLTREEVIAMVGGSAVLKQDEDTLNLNTAPRPHPDFEDYRVVISPERGLLKLGAISKNVDTTKYGDELKRKFYDLKNALEESYGPSKTYDFLRAGSIWHESGDWMMGLLKKERTLVAFWQFQNQENHLTSIAIEAHASSQETGFLVITYEFEGWSEYLGSKKAKSNEVF